MSLNRRDTHDFCNASNLKQVLGRLCGMVEAASKCSLAIHLACALAASLCVSFFLCGTASMGEPQTPYVRCAWHALFAVMVYMIVALLIQRFWTGTLARVLPNWIPIAVFGSALYLSILIASATTGLWEAYSRLTKEPNLFEFIVEVLDKQRSVLVGLWFITLPITALIYYAGSIVKVVRH